MSKIFTTNVSGGNLDIKAHMTPWLTLRSALLQKAYNKFKFGHSNFYGFATLQLLTTVFITVTYMSTITYFPTRLATAGFIIALVTPVLLGWLLVFLRLMKSVDGDRTFFARDLTESICFLESWWLLGFCGSMAIQVALMGVNGHCPEGIDAGDYSGMGCSYSGVHQMQEDYTVMSTIMPIALSMIVKGASWRYVMTAYGITIFSAIFTMYYFDLTRSMMTFCLFIPFVIFVMYECQRQNVAMFLLTQSQEELLAENERLAEETRANDLRHMIGNVAHDLKTPLSAFVSGMDLILSILNELQSQASIPLTRNISKSLEAIGDSVRNMKDTNAFMLMTINRCIDYTKASQGLKLVPRMETINFAEAICLPLNCMKNLQDKQIEIILKPLPADMNPHVITDKQWLQENILCLLSNAVKFTTSGEVVVAVSLESRIDTPIAHVPSTENSSSSSSSRDRGTGLLPTHMIRIEIQDSGIGISDEAMSTLFGVFRQAQRMVGGTGLGLYSLAKRIDALHGQCGVTKRRDGATGSLFWFTIPYRPDNSIVLFMNQDSVRTEAVTCVTELAPSPTAHFVDMSSLNILIVDDSLSILKMSSMLLKKHGYRVSTANNGAEALEMLTAQFNDIKSGSIKEQERFDVVLMDLQMPVMDGLESTSRLRKLEKSCSGGDTTLHRQLIIGVSACSDHDTVEAAFAAGIDEFIAKPFNLQNFHETYRLLKRKDKNIFVE